MLPEETREDKIILSNADTMKHLEVYGFDHGQEKYSLFLEFKCVPEVG